MPELAVEVTLQPIQAFDFDAAILFSDILFPLKVLGITPCFEEKEGLRLNGPVWTELSCPTDLAAALKESIGSVYTAASMLVQNLDRPLIGFSGAPWTLAAFLIEGGSSQDFRKARAALQSPRFKRLISLLEDLIVAHLKLQIEAGCHAIQIFDSRVDFLPHSAVEEYSFAPFRRIVSRLPPCPVIFYKARASGYPLVERTALSFDTSVDLSMVRQTLPHSTAIQGNLDPHLLLGPREELIRHVRQICYSMQEDKGFIFNLANGILPGTDEGAVQCLVETIREATSESLNC
jgi:uroporphyrinogen decarboxylase